MQEPARRVSIIPLPRRRIQRMLRPLLLQTGGTRNQDTVSDLRFSCCTIEAPPALDVLLRARQFLGNVTSWYMPEYLELHLSFGADLLSRCGTIIDVVDSEATVLDGVICSVARKNHAQVALYPDPHRWSDLQHHCRRDSLLTQLRRRISSKRRENIVWIHERGMPDCRIMPWHLYLDISRSPCLRGGRHTQRQSSQSTRVQRRSFELCVPQLLWWGQLVISPLRAEGLSSSFYER
jgi:hypothetical protein